MILHLTVWVFNHNVVMYFGDLSCGFVCLRLTSSHLNLHLCSRVRVCLFDTDFVTSESSFVQSGACLFV